MLDYRMTFAALAVLAAPLPAAAAAPSNVQLAQARPATQAPAQARPAQAQPQAQSTSRANLVRGLDAAFKGMDTNNNGSLDTAELQAAEARVQQQRLAMIRRNLENEFTRLDTDKNGQLSKAEFMVAAPTRASTPPNGAAILAQLDRNKDGRVSADEYRAPSLANFDRIDANKDGTVTPAERQAAQRRR